MVRGHTWIGAVMVLAGCAAEGSVPSLVSFGAGEHVVVRESDALDGAGDETASDGTASDVGAAGESLVDRSSGSPRPWEPGAGYFVEDRDDPERATYYDTCGDSVTTDSGPIEIINEVEVFPATSERRINGFVTAVPATPTFIDLDGNPIVPGTRILGTTQRYTSSYVSCTLEPQVLDLGLVVGIDARVIFEEQCHEYWDYGQDRYRVWFDARRRCEGTQCDDPLVDLVVGNASCRRIGMNVFRRVPPPSI